LLATANVPLRIVAEDERFALRSVFVEVRRKDREGKVEPTKHLPLYHHAAAAELLAAVPRSVTWPLAVPAPAFRLRPKQLEIDWRWPLAGFAKDGDILYLQACADDFNNVSPFNPP